MVIFNPDEPIETIMDCALVEATTLTEYFKLNGSEGKEGEEARKLTYQEFPQKFVWDKTKKVWTFRKRGFAIGRMCFVPPTAGECFYLRTLLTVVCGPKSFDDLRTFEGILYPTFKDACNARGLLDDDGEWRLCLVDASQFQTETRLRHLFTSILLFCQVSCPEALWSEFREHICDDLRIRINNPTNDQVFDYGLFLINQILSDSGYDLRNFPHMPLPVENWSTVTGNLFIADQLSYNSEKERALFRQHLENVQQVPEQLDAFNTIVDSIVSG